MIFPLIANIIGVIVGITLIIVNIRFKRGLIGSLLKNYYHWLITASVIFTLGFIMEIFEELGFYEKVFEPLHHIFIITAAILFVITSLRLPKEASVCVAEHLEQIAKKQ